MERGYVILRTQTYRANLLVIHVLLCVVISTEAHDDGFGNSGFSWLFIRRWMVSLCCCPLSSSQNSVCAQSGCCASHKANFLSKCREFCGEPIVYRSKKWGKYTTIDGKPVLVRDCGDTVGSEGDPQVQRQWSLIPWLDVGIIMVNHRHDWLLSYSLFPSALNGQWSVLVGLFFMLMLDKGNFFIFSQPIDKSYTRKFTILAIFGTNTKAFREVKVKASLEN